MNPFMTVEEILSQASDEHSTVEQLDILVSKTRELSALRERELQQLKSILEDLEQRLYRNED